jgi:Reverse transcriptase (RNA-dependent DNA polymerase)
VLTSLAAVVYQSIAKGSDTDKSFLPQMRAYATKPNFHLRRTLKLDAVAEFFLYDITYRHRSKFKKSPRADRSSFGYRFSGGRMVSPAESYREFRLAVRAGLRKYRFCVKLDVAQYFNSIYHHDIVHWFRDYAKSEEEVALLGRFLREINAGRSIDCLPHGIFPAKIIGSQLLQFIEETNQLEASVTLRFMDDVYLFGDDQDVLARDFQTLQRLLGAKGLSVNPSKTRFGRVDEVNVRREVDKIKIGLLKRRGDIILGSGADDDYWQGDDDGKLSPEQVEYLLDLLQDDHIEEEDAELVLAVMRDHSGDVLQHFEVILERFPSLIKNIYHFGRHVEDKASLLAITRKFVEMSPVVTEFQLFWIAKLCQDTLLQTPGVGELMMSLLQHPAATPISKGKVLEIPEKRFGMPDFREAQVNTGSSEWLAWCSAVGSREIQKAKRNHLLMYFAKGSWFNQVVAECIGSIS